MHLPATSLRGMPLLSRLSCVLQKHVLLKLQQEQGIDLASTGKTVYAMNKASFGGR